MKLLSWEHAGFYLRLFSCWSPSWPLLAGAQLELSLIWKIQLLQLQRSRKWRIQMGVRKRRRVESWLHANETFVVFQMNKIKTVLLLKRPKKSANLESIHTLPAAKHNKWVRNIMYLPVKYPRKQTSCACLPAGSHFLSYPKSACLRWRRRPRGEELGEGRADWWIRAGRERSLTGGLTASDADVDIQVGHLIPLMFPSCPTIITNIE